VNHRFRAALRTATATSVLFGASMGMVINSISPAAASNSGIGATAAGGSAIGPPASPATVATSTAALASSLLTQTERYILEFVPSTDATSEATIHVQRGMAVQSVLTNVFAGEIADLTASQVKSLRLNPKVRLIEADTRVQAEANPAPVTQSPATWGLDRIDQRANTPSNSYSYDTTGSGVKAYVVDSGILSTHTDFSGRVTSGFSVWGRPQLSSNGTCTRNDVPSAESPPSTADEYGHGTHVAGIIGGTTYGVAKGVTLVPVRVLDCTGGAVASDVVKGLEFVIGDHVAGTPAVANLSLSGLKPNTPIDNAVMATIADGVSVVVAAGNSNQNSCERSPSRVTAAITVGAVDSSDRRATFSNFGSCVDLFAPGVSITSDWKDDGIPANKNRSVMVVSGTSMATPHAAGAAALILGTDPTKSPAAVATALKNLATVGAISDAGEDSPNRLLNTGVITELPSKPSAVTAANPSNGATKISWTRSTSTPILDQRVNAYSNGTLIKTTVVSATATTLTFGPLTPGSAHTFTVQARNVVGLSAESTPSNAIVWRTAPSIPTSVAATITAAGTASVTWTIASDGGSVLTEQILRTYRGTDLVATTTLSGTDIGFTTATPLDAGIAYKFTVQARNAIGTSTASAYSNTITRITAPTAPTNVVAEVKSASNAKISWSPRSNGGSPVIGQVVRAYANGTYHASFDVSGSAKSLTLTNLSPGVSYTFTVQARNLVDTGSESVPSNAIIRVR
jgi:subtilisin family serine protease